MLAAAAEYEVGGRDLLALAVESQSLWPGFRAALEADSRLTIDYRNDGTLLVALGRDEVARLQFRWNMHRRANLDSRWLNGAEVRELEPGLRGSVSAGILCPGDHQVDPRRMISALRRALRACGGHLFENHPVASIDCSAGSVSGIVLAAGYCRARSVILATGVWSAEMLRPLGIEIPVRPLKGQALALAANRQTGTLRHVIWTEQIHLAPKSDGRLIVGATMEDTGFNAAITAGGTLALLEGVHRALPSSEEMELEAVWSGFRPTTDDDAPIIGASGIAGLYICTGHHRNGILLAPVTAKTFEDLFTRGAGTGVTERFGIARFHPAVTNKASPVGDET
jgi:glycine oxidase